MDNKKKVKSIKYIKQQRNKAKNITNKVHTNPNKKRLYIQFNLN